MEKHSQGRLSNCKTPQPVLPTKSSNIIVEFRELRERNGNNPCALGCAELSPARFLLIGEIVLRVVKCLLVLHGGQNTL